MNKIIQEHGLGSSVDLGYTGRDPQLAQAIDRIGLMMNEVLGVVLVIHEMLMRAGLGPEATTEPKEPQPPNS
jgi:hypothetical protein